MQVSAQCSRAAQRDSTRDAMVRQTRASRNCGEGDGCCGCLQAASACRLRPNVSAAVQVQRVQHVVHQARRIHQPCNSSAGSAISRIRVCSVITGVDCASHEAPQRVPRHVVEPVVKLVETCAAKPSDAAADEAAGETGRAPSLTMYLVARKLNQGSNSWMTLS